MTFILDKDTVMPGTALQLAAEVAALPFPIQEVFLKELSDQLSRKGILYLASSKEGHKKIAARLSAASGKILDASTNIYMIRIDAPEQSL